MAKLRKAFEGRPESVRRVRAGRDGRLALEVPMRENDAVLVEVGR